MTIHYDLDSLNNLVSDLQTIHGDYSGIDGSMDTAAAAAGYSSLAGALNDFSDNWSRNRAKQLEDLEGAHTSLAEIVGQLEEYDDNGVTKLREK